MTNERARSLRKQMTPQEVKLWVHLRSWRSRGFHFRRQVERSGYIVDFACLRRKLIIELDGGQHALPEHNRKDVSRDAHLASDGFCVLRFWNSDVDRNLAGVLDVIDTALNGPPTPALRADPPPLGEGRR